MKKLKSSSEFKDLQEIEYFDFEEDFIAANIRCIPMIVRFKMDAVGVKLKLAEWSRFKPEDRIELAMKSIATAESLVSYKAYLCGLINSYTKNSPSLMDIDPSPAWAKKPRLPILLQERLKELNVNLSLNTWRKLTDLQRFALLKLCRPGHENKNFPKAMKEFGLM